MLNPISFRHRLHVAVRIFKQWQHPSRANHLRSTYWTSRHAIKRKIVPHPSFARITRTFPDCRICLWNFFQWLFAIIHDFYPLVMEKHLTDVISQKPILSGSLTPRSATASTTYWANLHLSAQKKEAAFTIITC